MEIVVVSDTHMPKRTKKLPRQLVKDLEKADLIIHAEHVFYDSKKQGKRKQFCWQEKELRNGKEKK